MNYFLLSIMQVPDKVVGSIANKNFRFSLMGKDKDSLEVERLDFSTEKIKALHCNCPSPDHIRIFLLNYLTDFGLTLVSSEVYDEDWSPHGQVRYFDYFLKTELPISLKAITG